MKITTSAGALTGAFSLARSIIDERATRRLPVLGLAHLKAADGALTIAGANLDAYLSLSAPVDVVVPPPGVVPMSGATDAHGMSDGAMQSTVPASSPVTFITRCMFGKPIAAVSVGSGTPQSAAAR